MEMLCSDQGTELSSFAGRTKQDLSVFQAHVLFFPAGLCDQCIGRFNFCLWENKAHFAPPAPQEFTAPLVPKFNHKHGKLGNVARFSVHAHSVNQERCTRVHNQDRSDRFESLLKRFYCTTQPLPGPSWSTAAEMGLVQHRGCSRRDAAAGFPPAALQKPALHPSAPVCLPACFQSHQFIGAVKSSVAKIKCPNCKC